MESRETAVAVAGLIADAVRNLQAVAAIGAAGHAGEPVRMAVASALIIAEDAHARALRAIG